MTQLKEHFEHDGFVVIPDLLGAEDIAAARTAAGVIMDSFDPAKHPTVFTTTDRDKGRDQYFMDSAQAIHCFAEADAVAADGTLTRPKREAINKIGHALHDFDPTFARLCRLPRIGSVLRELGYHTPQVWQTMYICKPPKIGGEVRWHQDTAYLSTTPACVTGVWIALEKATVANGCLWVQPGGHRTPRRELYEVDADTGTGTLRELDSTPWPGTDDARALEVEAGTAVFFSDHLPHYSSHNHSTRSRHAFTLHVAERDTNWSQDNWLQRPDLPPFEI